MKAKRIRPISMSLANYVYSGDFTSCIPLAYAIEIFHNFTLVHDDIMDEAPLRRGRETVHAKFGNNAEYYPEI